MIVNDCQPVLIRLDGILLIHGDPGAGRSQRLFQSASKVFRFTLRWRKNRGFRLAQHIMFDDIALMCIETTRLGRSRRIDNKRNGERQPKTPHQADGREGHAPPRSYERVEIA